MAKALHTRMKVFSRSKGDSPVAAAAYRSGTNILDERATVIRIQELEERARQNNQPLPEDIKPVVHYYQRKSDVLRELSEIVVSENAPSWAKTIADNQDRQTFYNLVDASEKRVDSQLLREFEGELSRHLDMETNKNLLREIVVDQFVSKGMVADINIHNHIASDGGQNPHFHVLLTMRVLEETGFGNKNREWNNYYSEKRQDVVANELRTDLANRTNTAHEKAGIPIRIDPRSYEEQGVTLQPGNHIGSAAHAMEDKGIQTENGDRWRDNRIKNTVEEFYRAMDSPAVGQQIRDTFHWERTRRPGEIEKPVPELEAQKERKKGYER